ncbi:MAG: protein phosphatase 2C domain-containing protein [Microthrixaceae bacterium]|nr:serine/threonine-protein phosphatase [Microthrixaceae bacterium]MCO5319090.1 protein phosphatase 2C domain-containing protein [Microthrixaceae bacterium]
MLIRLEFGSASVVGQVRSGNEDSVLVADGLAAVADGMGGHRAGEVASADAIDALADMEGNRSLDDLVRTVHWANRRISERASADPELRGMGTTVCAVGLVNFEDREQLAVVNVGDSRVYLLGAEGFRQLSEDHSLVESLVREGQITAEEAQSHPQRNVLTRALGVEPVVAVDAWLLRPLSGERILLCSDGLTNELDDERIAAVLGDGDPAELTAQRLAAEADAAGGRDNTSVVVIDIVDSDTADAPFEQRFDRLTTPSVDLSEEGEGPNTERVMAVIPTEATQLSDVAPAPEQPEPMTGDEDIAELAGASDEGDLAAAQAEAAAAGALAARWRTAAFVVAILGVIGLAVGAILFTAGRGWYVREGPDGQVALYRGTPVLWIDPVLVDESGAALEDLTEADAARVRRGRTFSEEATAREFIENIRATTTTTTSTTTTTTSTTTTVRPTTTAPPAGAPTTNAPPGQ